MKRLTVLVCAVLVCAVLCACAPAQRAETTAAPTASLPMPSTAAPEPTDAPQPTDAPAAQQNSAYAPYDNALVPQALGVVLNAPFTDEPPVPNERWLEDEYEQAYIIARYVGTVVELYSMQYDEAEQSLIIAPEPDYQSIASDGSVIFSALPRPEGMPLYYLRFVAPDGSEYGMQLSYNGRTGTSELEYCCEPLDEALAQVCMLGALDAQEYSWGVQEQCTVIGGVPYVNFRLMRMVSDDGGAHQSYVVNVLVAPSGALYAAEADAENDFWTIAGELLPYLA